MENYFAITTRKFARNFWRSQIRIEITSISKVGVGLFVAIFYSEENIFQFVDLFLGCTKGWRWSVACPIYSFVGYKSDFIADSCVKIGCLYRTRVYLDGFSCRPYPIDEKREVWGTRMSIGIYNQKMDAPIWCSISYIVFFKSRNVEFTFK